MRRSQSSNSLANGNGTDQDTFPTNATHLCHIAPLLSEALRRIMTVEADIESHLGFTSAHMIRLESSESVAEVKLGRAVRPKDA
jgi:hypothetical protein